MLTMIQTRPYRR